MKRKIGELRNIPIVEGDKNLVREGTEIHINDLQSKGDSSFGGGKMEYYKLNLDKYASMGNDAPFGAVFYIGYGYPSLLRIKQNDIFVIGSYGLAGYYNIHNVEDLLSIGVDAISFDPNIKIIVNNPQGTQFYANNVKEYIDYVITQGAYHEDDALIPITEEEFYNLN